MSSKKVNIITSYYSDGQKFNWKDRCKDFLDPDTDLQFFVYVKKDDLHLDPSICNQIETGEFLIPNIGRCDFAFLLHIIRNYDNLSDVNVFTKVNWMDQRNDFFDLLTNSQKYDFCDVGDTPELQIWDTEILDSNVQEYLVKNLPSGSKYQLVDSRKNKSNGNYYHAFKSDCLNDWYGEIFKECTPPKPFWSWAHGPCFSVSREAIRRHPREVYEYLLNRFLPESNSWEKDLGKKLMSEAKGYEVSDKEVMDDAAHHYHDNLLRFWRVLFTHNLDKEKFNIKIN